MVVSADSPLRQRRSPEFSRAGAAGRKPLTGGAPARRTEGRRDVAQSGSALEWGSRGRRFKSFHPDQVRDHPKGNLKFQVPFSRFGRRLEASPEILLPIFRPAHDVWIDFYTCDGSMVFVS